MTNSLMVPVNNSIEESMSEISSGAYLPYVQLLDSRSPKVTGPGSEKYEGYPNKLVLVKGKELQIIGNGLRFDAKLIDVRMKASFWAEGVTETAYSGVKSGGDPEAYSRLAKNAKDFVKGHKVGGEYLIYIAELDELASIYCGASADRKLASIQAFELMKKGISDVTFLREWYAPKNAKHPRWAVSCTQCVDTIEGAPDPEKLLFELERFQNPVQFTATADAEPAEDGR